MSHPNPPQQLPWAAIFAGLAASLLGIGLARFGYTPLIPSLIAAHWFSASEVIYLSAANLAGYLIGALIARPLGRQLGNILSLRAMMLLTAAAFFACAFPLSISWFFAWRLLSGITGGVIMVLVAATVLPHIPPQRRGIAGGIIFLGLGLGVAGSGTLIPVLLHWGLQNTWLGLGLIALLLTGVSWQAWPQSPNPRQPVPNSPQVPSTGAIVSLFYLQYGLMAIGVVAAMVFLVDFIARGLGLGAHIGALFWVCYGIGALVGPVAYGQLGDKLGASRAIQWLLPAQALALTPLVLSHNLLLLAVATFVIGSFPAGMVPLALHKVHQLLPGDHHSQAAIWSRATVVFAAFQALAGYGDSFLFNLSHGSYALLFAVSIAALLIALGLEWLSQLLSARVPVPENSF